MKYHLEFINISEQPSNECVIADLVTGADCADPTTIVDPNQLENCLKKIIEISKPDNIDSSDYGLLEQLRSSWFGKLYLKHLKRHHVFHVLFIWLWRVAYPKYVKYVAVPIKFLHDKKFRSLLRWRNLTNQSNYLLSTNSNLVRISLASKVEIPVPVVIPVSDSKYVFSDCDNYIFPSVFITEISNALISGGTNLIIADDVVICHDLFDLIHDTTSEELHGRVSFDAKGGKIRWLVHDDMPESLSCGAVFIDATAENYAHWMAEVLTRIAMFCAEPEYADVPLIVNAGLHTNIMTSLVLIAGAQREIICLPIGRAIAVERLFLTSVCGYVPFGRRSVRKETKYSHGIFSPIALAEMRSKLLASAVSSNVQKWPKKIYIKRNSSLRSIINSQEVEDLLVAFGYTIVEPEKLSFQDQIKIFSNESEIISPTGAALVNAIFSSPGSVVTVLMGKHKDMIYRYWLNMFSPLGLQVKYILGDIPKKSSLGIHDNYYIDIKSLTKYLENLN